MVQNKFTPVVKGVVPPPNSAITVTGSADIVRKTGTPLDISSITWSADVATVNTVSNHLLSTGDYVEVESVVPDTYNGYISSNCYLLQTDYHCSLRVGNPGSYITSWSQLQQVYLNESGYLELDVICCMHILTGQTSWV